MTSPKTIRATSSEVRTAFAQWLAHDLPTEIKVVILEGLTASGKTTLAKQPFILDGRPSATIAMDSFLPRDVEEATPFLAAVDQSAMTAKLQAALGGPALVIVEGAIVWPAVEPVIAKLGVDGVRRVYLKRMSQAIPNFWADEDFIADPAWWPPTGFHRSIYEYHARQSPWLYSDLVIERVEEKPGLPSDLAG